MKQPPIFELVRTGKLRSALEREFGEGDTVDEIMGAILDHLGVTE